MKKDPPELKPIVEEAPVPPVGPEGAPNGRATVHADEAVHSESGRGAAAVLVEHLFAPKAAVAGSIEYAVEYRLAGGTIGGDVVDVYAFDNGSVMFTMADITGKGHRAAVHAAMVKYAVRGFASEMYTPEKVLLALDRLYTENASFEREESFATIFFAATDEHRQTLMYASAAHDTVFLMYDDGEPEMLPVTAPLIGVFQAQRHLFHQRFLPITPRTVLVAVSDGITEARREPRGSDFFGTERVLRLIAEHRGAPMETLAQRIIDEVNRFTSNRAHDDMAVLAVRFLP